MSILINLLQEDRNSSPARSKRSTYERKTNWRTKTLGPNHHCHAANSTSRRPWWSRPPSSHAILSPPRSSGQIGPSSDQIAVAGDPDRSTSTTPQHLTRHKKRVNT